MSYREFSFDMNLSALAWNFIGQPSTVVCHLFVLSNYGDGGDRMVLCSFLLCLVFIYSMVCGSGGGFEA